MLKIMEGVGDLLLFKMVGAKEMRTQFCRLCPLRAFGLPFSAEGLPVRSGEGSHWNGLPLLLRRDDA